MPAMLGLVMRQIFLPEGKGSLMFFISTEASYCRLKGIAATESGDEGGNLKFKNIR